MRYLNCHYPPLPVNANNQISLKSFNPSLASQFDYDWTPVRVCEMKSIRYQV